MRGIIFTEFLEFAEEQFGFALVQSVLDKTELKSGGAYTAVGNYPYSELETVLIALIKEVQTVSADDALFGFGKWLASSFQNKYADFFSGHTDAISFLSTIDEHIHTEVRKLYPDAVPPSVRLERVNDDQYLLHYNSHRPLASVASGLAVGSIEAFGGQWDVSTKALSEDAKAMSLSLQRKLA
jgi:hypothetical protein